MFSRLLQAPRFVNAGVIGLALSATVSEATFAEQPPSETGAPPASAERPAQVAMRQLANETRFVTIPADGSEPRVLELRKQPVVTYGDETRFIKDSTLWVWMDGDRPAVFQKIEVNDWVEGSPQWTWCFASASPELLHGSWPGSVDRETTSGNSYRPVPNAMMPRDNPTAWPLEARSLSRKFSARCAKDQLRLVSRPVLEFKAPKKGVPYGAVFSFATGTNPDVLLIVQVEEGPDGKLWTWAPLHMTSNDVGMTFEDEVIWDEPAQRSGDATTWGYFFTRRDPSIK
jgi:hypothetical protein